MYLTRIWAFSMHKHKSILLGRWPEYTHPRKRGDKSTKLNKNTSIQVTKLLLFFHEVYYQLLNIFTTLSCKATMAVDYLQLTIIMNMTMSIHNQYHTMTSL